MEKGKGGMSVPSLQHQELQLVTQVECLGFLCEEIGPALDAASRLAMGVVVGWYIGWDRARSGGAGGVSDGTGHCQVGQVVCQMGQGMVRWGRWCYCYSNVAVSSSLLGRHWTTTSMVS